MKIDGFLVAMLAAVLLALAWPVLGTSNGMLHLDLVTKIGIAAVFLLHGAGLAPAALTSGAARWRLHLLVQTTTFVVFPIVGGVVWIASRGMLPDGLRLGFFYLCALPSTISSSIAMTALARGNVSVAIFNATLSGLIGMFATPLLIGLVARLGVGGPSLGAAMVEIVKTLLVPFALGQLCRPLIGGWIMRNKRVTTMVDRGVILLIVYGAFCESTASGLWSQFSIQTLGIVAGLALALLALALGYTAAVARWMKLDRADEAAAIFCGAKKSLASGAPMARILFAGNPAMGMIVLPILLYHQIQLIVCASLARRYALRRDATSEPPGGFPAAARALEEVA